MIQVTGDDGDINTESDQTTFERIPWTIQSRSNLGIQGLKLDYSSTQKDWATIKSYKLTDDFGIGVIAKPGWEKDLNTEIPYAIAVSFESVNRDIEIYERIRIANQIEIVQEIQV